MLVVVPLVNYTEMIYQTDVPLKSTDPTMEWDEGTVYYTGDVVSFENAIYVAQYNNYGVNPRLQDLFFWDYQGYLNPYAFLSSFTSNRTEVYSSADPASMSFRLTNTNLLFPPHIDTFGFFGVEGDVFTISSDDVVETLSLYTPNTKPNNVLRFISDYHRKRSIIYHLDDPAPLDMNITLSALSVSYKIGIGNFCAGVAVDSGLTQVGSEISMTQNSTTRVMSGWKTRDAGRSVFRHSLIVSCPSDNLDSVIDLYDGLAGVQTMYRMTAGFDYHWIYGMWTNFSFLYSNGDLSYYTVEIETTAYPQTLPPGYNMKLPIYN